MEKKDIFKFISLILLILLIGSALKWYNTEKQLDSINGNFDKLKQESEQKLVDAEIIAKKKIEDAAREAEVKIKQADSLKNIYSNLIAREEKKLQNYYNNLYRFSGGDNYFNDFAIKKFRIDGNKIFVTIQNNGSQSIKPNFKIYFLNENGFITSEYSDIYVFSSIAPGETRISDGEVNFRYGTPVYYCLWREY
ncbi:MAG: hypothetical protein N2321_01885 [Melioribacteraceae bacterium]|nr:hypothetical protein [Melioribacteraceae bacterium]